MPPPKKNKFQKTNKKKVEKLGKGKKAPANAIQTAFQSRGILMPLLQVDSLHSSFPLVIDLAATK